MLRMNMWLFLAMTPFVVLSLYSLVMIALLLLGIGKLHVKRDIIEGVRDPETGEVFLRPIREEYNLDLKTGRKEPRVE